MFTCTQYRQSAKPNIVRAFLFSIYIYIYIYIFLNSQLLALLKNLTFTCCKQLQIFLTDASGGGDHERGLEK